MTADDRTTGLKRCAYLFLGWAMFALGFIGAFVPVMPTTVFMIAALWAFARSSRRLHDWLYGHSVFGPPLRRWRTHRVIPLHAKVFALAGMSLSMIYMLSLASIPPVALVFAGAFMAYGAFYILSKPSQVPESEI